MLGFTGGVGFGHRGAMVLSYDLTKGATLGPELWGAAGVLINDAGGASVTYTDATRNLAVTVAGNNTGYPRVRFNLGLVAGKMYQVAGQVVGTANLVTVVRLAITGAANNVPYAGGVVSGITQAGGAILEVLCNGTVTGTVEFQEFSVREVIPVWRPMGAA